MRSRGGPILRRTERARDVTESSHYRFVFNKRAARTHGGIRPRGVDQGRPRVGRRCGREGDRPGERGRAVTLRAGPNGTAAHTVARPGSPARSRSPAAA